VVHRSLELGSRGLASLVANVLRVLEVRVELWPAFESWLTGLLLLQFAKLDAGDGATPTEDWRSASRTPYQVPDDSTFESYFHKTSVVHSSRSS